MIKKTCIYYDLKSINKKDIQTILEKYDNEWTIHIYKDSIEWSDVHDLKREKIGSERSSEYRNDLMKKIDVLFEEIRSLTEFEDVINNQGIDLLEVARYDFFFPVSYLVYPIWVLEQIIKIHSPETIIWISSDQTTSIPKRILEEYLEPKGITLIYWSAHKSITTDYPKYGKILFWKITLSDIKKSVFEAFHCLTQKPYTQTTREYGKIDILFLENFPNSAKVSASTAKELENKQGINYCFAATQTSVLDVVSFLSNTLLIKNVLRPTDWIKVAYKQFKVSWLALVIVNGMISGRFTHWRETGKLIDQKLRFSIAKTFRRATETIINNNVLINTFQPKIGVTTNQSNSFSRAFVAAANNHGASTFLIQHGFPAYDEYEDYMLQKNVLVWGKKDKEQWLKRGYSPGNIKITGSSKFENSDLVNTDHRDIPVKNSLLKLTYFPSLLNGSTTSEEMSIRALEMVLNTVNRLDNVSLTVKTKSEDDFSIINNYEESDTVKVINDRDAMDVIQESDIIIVTTSNVGLEACSVGKPLIALNLPGLKLFSFYEEYGCALLASSENQLQDAIDNVVNDENIRLELRKGCAILRENVFNGCIPGSSKRIAEILTNNINVN